MPTHSVLRPLLLAFLLVSVLAPSSASAQVAPDGGLTRTMLADGVYLFRAPSTLDLWTATNSVVVINQNDVTVFDSHTRARTARMLIAEIRKLTGKPVRTLINSHWHQDHWSGNEEFVKAYPGVQIIATTETRDFMKRMGAGYFAASIDNALAGARATHDSAVKKGKMEDGTPLTDSARTAMEREITEVSAWQKEVATLRRVLPTVAYRDTLVLWSGNREFRLISVTGDATASTVLYLPAERLLVMGDALVAQEDGTGGPPWTTTSYSITPWLNSLRGLDGLDVTTIVPGQGTAFHDKHYLELTIRTYAAIIGQVHSALERDVVGLAAVQAAVDVDSLGKQYNPGGELPATWRNWVGRLSAKVYQESLDGVAR